MTTYQRLMQELDILKNHTKLTRTQHGIVSVIVSLASQLQKEHEKEIAELGVYRDE